ncbi:hypothetical protein OROHE_017747 [Orobanche hederae]
MAKATNTTIIPYLLITTAILICAASLPFTNAQLPTANTLQLATVVPIKVSSSPGPDCFTDVADLADCLSYVEGGSNMTKPDPSCCPEMSNLLNTHPTCLCELIANSTKFGLSDINVDRAIGLPSFCNLIKGSPVDLCEAIGIPVTISAPPSPSEAAAKPSPGLAFNERLVVDLSLVLFTYFL